MIKSYVTYYVLDKRNEKILADDKVIIKDGGKCFTCFVTEISKKYMYVRNGVNRYIKNRHSDGKFAEYLNSKRILLTDIQTICRYPKDSQKEPFYISNNNWKNKNLR